MKANLTTCPTCGSPKLLHLRSDFSLRTGGKLTVIPKLDRYECPRCGEVLFDYDAIKRIEDARQPRRKLSKSA